MAHTVCLPGTRRDENGTFKQFHVFSSAEPTGFQNYYKTLVSTAQLVIYGRSYIVEYAICSQNRTIRLSPREQAGTNKKCNFWCRKLQFYNCRLLSPEVEYLKSFFRVLEILFEKKWRKIVENIFLCSKNGWENLELTSSVIFCKTRKIFT